MKTQKTASRLIVMGIAIVALVGMWGVRPARAIIIQTTASAIAGVSSGQTARLVLFNRGQEHGIIIQGVRFVSSDGAVLLEFQGTEPGRPIVLQPGQTRSFDLNRDSLGDIGDVNGRIQLRVEISLLGGPDTQIDKALEVFDNATGRTTAFSCGNNL